MDQFLEQSFYVSISGFFYYFKLQSNQSQDQCELFKEVQFDFCELHLNTKKKVQRVKCVQ